jgi:electron-transferring-flavoprotein dehydrogenase
VRTAEDRAGDGMARDTLEVDILIVGAGPAGLAAALRLAQLQKQDQAAPLTVAVLEKAREAGAHSLSGAVLDPSALRLLVPDYEAKGAPLETPVRTDRVLFLTSTRTIAFPITPPPLRNHGNFVVSLNALVRWMAGQVEAEGIDFFTGFSGRDVLMEGARVVGVRTGDRGVGRDGREKPGFEPGVDIHAQVTIFCDGVRGNLTKELLRRLQLGRGREPEQFALGVKELWDVPRGRLEPGTVVHTLGYPLTQDQFGGGFIYGMADGRVSLGLVVGLDYRDPFFDPHTAFNRFKQHPFLTALLADGQLVRYGAKALPEGGWNTIPQPYASGALIAGDAGGFLNSMRLKGIHLAMRTGMLAAETAYDAVRAGDTSDAALRAYQTRIDASEVRAELYPVRNVHQAFGHGLFAGLAFSGLALVTGGRWPGRVSGEPGHDRMQRIEAYYGTRTPPADAGAALVDRRLTFDKVTNVHYSGTAHEEDQPPHLLVHTDVCATICGPEYGHPCTRFCPANVYEIAREADGTPRLQINASNCVHCKTCDIMDPYAVITWVPPEGGGGPQYTGM